MCIVSNVFDHYRPLIPPIQPTIPVYPFPPGTYPMPASWMPPQEVEELRNLLKEFRDAVEMAKKLDVLMKKPDCEDPEKAKLLIRVAELEKMLEKTEKKKSKKKVVKHGKKILHRK